MSPMAARVDLPPILPKQTLAEFQSDISTAVQCACGGGEERRKREEKKRETFVAVRTRSRWRLFLSESPTRPMYENGKLKPLHSEYEMWS